MKKLLVLLMIVGLVIAGSGKAQAESTWYTISFTGLDLFNYSTNVDELYNQSAPRRVREWAADDSLNWAKWSDTDSSTPSDGVNDYADWASTNLANYGFSYFNLYGATIAADYWDQPYHAVPDQDNGLFGADSWKNQTVNGVSVVPSMGDSAYWAGGIVLANQTYNNTDYAFPVWRAPIGTQLTLANAASLTFSVDVLIENYDTAFEPDGSLRVWFGGFNHPQDWTGVTTEVSGIMNVPEPSTMLLLGFGLVGLAGLRKRFKK